VEVLAKVGRRRDEQEPPFPDFRPAPIAEFGSRPHYPPSESGVRGREKPK
jgi:hypothetical protein